MLREFKAFSPSSFNLYNTNRIEFVKRYLLDPRPPYDPQTVQMALGSGFDAFVKNEMMRCLYGEESVKLGEEYHLETLFNAQVQDEEMRTRVWELSGGIFLRYKDSGAFDQLLIDMEGSEPEFEKELLGPLDLCGTILNIRGFPDGFYTTALGILVILDWKCTAYTSKKKMSPLKYYILERDGDKRRHHKNIKPILKNNLLIQDEYCFSKTDKKWATQICIYGWMLGKKVGEPFIGQIEQIICEPNVIENPKIRVVTYKSEIKSEFQVQLSENLSTAWNRIQNGDFFDGLNTAEADKKITELDKLNTMRAEDNPLMRLTRKRRMYG